MRSKKIRGRRESLPIHVNLGVQTRRRADRIAVCELDVREMQVPVVLASIDDHSQHLGHSMVRPLYALVTVWMIGACGKFAHSQSWWTACESFEQNWRPLSESMVHGHPHIGMYWFPRMLAVPSVRKTMTSNPE